MLQRSMRCFGVLLMLLLASGAWGAPSCKVSPQKAKLYRLDLTIPTTFCRGSAGDDPSCKTFPKVAAIQLHGLWPNYQQGGYPEGGCGVNACPLQEAAKGKYCGYPKPDGLYDSATWQSLSTYMAGTEKCLERHEWIKHGTCSGLDAEAYFQWSLETTKQIADGLRLPMDTPISQEEFVSLVKTRLPSMVGGLRRKCDGNALSGIYLLYEWHQPPARLIKLPDKPVHFGNCKKTFSVPSIAS